ncbi:MAG: site-specific integrase [Proteobacteria bacterium]|nr:site-specific integrase [Pseudomonadota bacterium]
MSQRRTAPTSFTVLVQDFFGSRLINERNVSPRTIASYRDTFRLLFRYAEKRLKNAPVELLLADLDANFVLGFLNHLERVRGNSARTRNVRLAAIRSFMRYASFRDPSVLPVVQRVLAIPLKRFERPLIGFLSREEIEAILSAPDCSTWTGHRDQMLLRTMYNTGARVSEIVALRVADVSLGTNAHVRISGKGRKERTIPLWRSTSKALKSWLSAHLRLEGRAPLFTNRRIEPLSRSGVEDRLRVAVRAAAETCLPLAERRVSPHIIRHTTAMHLLQSGVDITVIALWLGHESPATTHQYVETDLMMKERALARLQEAPATPTRYRASDTLLQFLNSL